jgi:hypothetical protein
LALERKEPAKNDGLAPKRADSAQDHPLSKCMVR